MLSVLISASFFLSHISYPIAVLGSPTQSCWRPASRKPPSSSWDVTKWVERPGAKTMGFDWKIPSCAKLWMKTVQNLWFMKNPCFRTSRFNFRVLSCFKHRHILLHTCWGFGIGKQVWIWPSEHGKNRHLKTNLGSHPNFWCKVWRLRPFDHFWTTQWGDQSSSVPFCSSHSCLDVADEEMMNLKRNSCLIGSWPNYSCLMLLDWLIVWWTTVSWQLDQPVPSPHLAPLLRLFLVLPAASTVQSVGEANPSAPGDQSQAYFYDLLCFFDNVTCKSHLSYYEQRKSCQIDVCILFQQPDSHSAL